MVGVAVVGGTVVALAALGTGEGHRVRGHPTVAGRREALRVVVEPVVDAVVVGVAAVVAGVLVPGTVVLVLPGTVVVEPVLVGAGAWARAAGPRAGR